LLVCRRAPFDEARRSRGRSHPPFPALGLPSLAPLVPSGCNAAIVYAVHRRGETMKNRLLILTVGLLWYCRAGTAMGEFRPQPLSPGMTAREVLTLWGSPLERVEQETKREEVWRYPGSSSVSFAVGKVIAWQIGATPRTGIPLSTAMLNADQVGAKAASTRTSSVSDDQMRDILDEIVQRSPDSPVSPTAP
jgi:hypothetical protein